MPRTLLTIWFVSPWPMNPAPIIPTRMAVPWASWAASARSTMIMFPPCERLDLHPAFELGLDLIEPLPGLVLVGNVGDRQRPLQPEPRVVPREAAFARRGVELAHLVARLGSVLERLVAVAKPFRDVEAAVVVRRQLDGDVLEIRRALRPEVHDDVEDRSAGRPHEFRLRRGRVLEVHSPDGSAAVVEGDVRLRDDRLQPALLELLLAEDAGEEAAAVFPALDVDEESALQPGFREDHSTLWNFAVALESKSTTQPPGTRKSNRYSPRSTLNVLAHGNRVKSHCGAALLLENSRLSNCRCVSVN